ncbi:MAG: hypothetical protein ACLPXB_19810 [Thiobacillaceae bacterium]
MIDTDLLRQLGWSEDLITEVVRVAEPMRLTVAKMNTGQRVTPVNFSSGANSIYIDPSTNIISKSIEVEISH